MPYKDCIIPPYDTENLMASIQLGESQNILNSQETMRLKKNYYIPIYK